MTAYGTSHFVSRAAAERYYAPQGADAADVQRKLDERLIHLGPPPLKPGETCSIIADEGRYQIEGTPHLTAYAAILAAGLPLDHHESDLYVKDSQQARDILRHYGKNWKPFTSQPDGERWLDVWFAYDPWWEGKRS